MSQLKLRKLASTLYLMVYGLLICPFTASSQNTYSCDIKYNSTVNTESSRRFSALVASQNQAGYQAWTSLENSILPDQRSIGVHLSPHRFSERLYFSNFDFNIPSNAFVTGIQVRVVGDLDTLGRVWDEVIALSKNGGQVSGDNKANQEIEGSAWNQDTLSQLGHWSYGSSVDRWGTTWSAADINNNNFGVVIQSKNRNEYDINLLIDQLIVIVYYDSGIEICNDHACVPVYVDDDPNVTNYNWSVSGPLQSEPIANRPYMVNVIAENVPFGEYEVCLNRSFNDGTSSTCCRAITFKDCTPGSIGDFVWKDLNGNGFQDNGEPGLNQCVVFLYNESLQIQDLAYTDNGMYLFNNVEPGNYIIQVDTKEYCPTQATSTNETLDSDFFEAYLKGGTDVITLGPSEHIRDIDFGLTNKTAIGDYVWLDENRNGLQDEGEEGVEGVVVRLESCTGEVIRETTTDANGLYSFQGLENGDYKVCFELDGFNLFPTISNGGDEDLDSDFSTSDSEACSDCFTIDDQNSIIDLDFGLVESININFSTWLDLNKDNLIGTDENPLEGVQIDVYSCDGTLINSGSTNANGTLTISDVELGDYYFIIGAPAGTRVNQNGVIDFTNGANSTTCLTVGPNGLNLDIPLCEVISAVRIFTFDDQNTNGVNDNEPGVASVEVEIYTCNGTFIGVFSTDNLGFLEVDLQNGSYYIRVISPEGFGFPNNGIINDANGPGTSDCFEINDNIVDLEVALIEGAVQIDVYTFNDLDLNILNDSNEPAIEGALVEIFLCNGTLFTQLTTDDQGGAWIYDVPPGDYYIRVTPPTGFSIVPGGIIDNSNGENTTACYNTAPFGFSIEVPLTMQQDPPSFENAPLNIFTFNDENTNGIFDGNELPVGDVLINVFDCTGAFIAGYSTNAQGQLQDELILGQQYYFQVVAPQDFEIILGGDITNSNGPGTTDCLILDSSGFNITVGLNATAPPPTDDKDQIDVYVFEDLNQDGLIDTNELLIEGVAVEIFECNGTLVSTHVTNIFGTIWNSELDEGDYYIRVALPSGFEFIQGAFIDNVNGPNTTSCYNTAPIGYSLFIGLVRSSEMAAIETNVWMDSNQNGIREASDSDLENISVVLRDMNDNIMMSQITDSEGDAMFINVLPGQYRVEIMDPDPLLVPTIFGAAAEDIDSDLLNENGRYISDMITVQANEFNEDTDLGLIEVIVPSGDIRGNVWLDSDGSLDRNNESGLEGVQVLLFDCEGNEVARTLTDDDGNYSFAPIAAGSYYIQINGIDNLSFGIGGDSNFDNSNGEGTSECFRLTPGETMIYNFAFLPTFSSIGNFVWFDENSNGVQDNSETGLADIELNLLDASGAVVGTEITSPEGLYRFENVRPGQYSIEITNAKDYQATTYQGSDVDTDSDLLEDGSLTSRIIDVVAGQEYNNIDFGLIREDVAPTGALGGIVFDDLNDDGVLNGTDIRLEGVEVTLYNESNDIVGTTNTDASGVYSFTGLAEGSYYVQFELLGTYEFVEPNLTIDELFDSDVVNDAGETDVFFLSDGQILQGVNAGMQKLGGCISGTYWKDFNQNGIIDEVPGSTANQNLRLNDEERIEDALVTLLNQNGDIVAETSTNQDGQYSFCNISAGNYRVAFSLIDDYIFTTPNTGTDELIDSDVTNPSNGQTEIFELIAGQDVIGINAGVFAAMGSISGSVWNDNDRNGMLTSGELGVGGITINLLSNNTIITSVTTDQNGNYRFADVAAGNYNLEIDYTSSATDWMLTTALVGVNPDIYSHFFILNNRTAQIDLGFGEIRENINAGLVELQEEITGTVWFDANQNGLFDNGESGLEAMEMRLLNSDGSLNATTSTDVSGAYSFVGMDPGDYRLEIVYSDAYDLTMALVGGNANLYSHFFKMNNQTQLISVSTNEVVNEINAGLINNENSVSGVIWFDSDQDGLLSSQEPRMEGVTINLTDQNQTVVTTTETNGNGMYFIGGFDDGTYFIEVELDDSFDFTTALVGGDPTIYSHVFQTLGRTGQLVFANNESRFNINGGLINRNNTLVGGTVWFDENENNSLDPTEIGMESILVEMFRMDGSLYESTLTSVTGSYLFEDVTPDTYYLRFEMIDDYQFAAFRAGGDTALDSEVADLVAGTTTQFAIGLGQQFVNVHAGFQKQDEPVITKTIINGFVWEDIDASGIRESLENGSNNVGVRLLDNNDVLIATVSTGPNPDTGIDGYFEFTDVDPGDYYISFALDTNAEITQTGQESSLTSKFQTDIFNINGQATETMNAGFYYFATIGDYVWWDRNEDGIQDADEGGYEGYFVKLYNESGNQIGFTFSDAQGFYNFGNLQPGQYYVQVDFQLGISFAPGLNGNILNDSNIDGSNGIGTSGTITLMSGQNDSTIDIGLVVAPASIGDFVWSDLNANGIQDADEPGINDVDVRLYNASGDLVRTATTATIDGQDGQYLIEEIAPGNYYVQFVFPQEFNITAADQGGNDALDSDVDNSQGFGTTSIFQLSAGESDLDIDLGLQSEAEVFTIGDKVWHDRNLDGTFDSNEPGVADVVVTLFRDNSEFIASTVTNNQGEYGFIDIPAGDYVIHFAAPNNFTFTDINAGGEDEDSDVNPSGSTDVFSYDGQSDLLNIDAGLVRPGNIIGGLVWWDQNEDGLYSNDEDVMHDATVWLLASNLLLLDETKTDAAGRYVFENIPNGPYIIQFASEPSMTFTVNNVGSDPTINSDADSDGYSRILNLTGQTVERHIDAGLVNFKAPGISNVYPNPVFTTEIELETFVYRDGLKTSYQIIDQFGQVIFASKESEEQNKGEYHQRIIIPEELNGQYYLRVKVGHRDDVHKLVILRR